MNFELRGILESGGISRHRYLSQSAEISECIVHHAMLARRWIAKALLDSVQNRIAGNGDSFRQLARVGFEQGRFVERSPISDTGLSPRTSS
jgi:hypothetical protein